MNIVPKRLSGLSKLAIAALGAGVATSAFAGEVYVVVNSNTGEVVVAGNSPDSSAWLRQNSIERSPQGWQQIYGDDAPGWAAVSCIKLANGSYFFEFASGHGSENAARGLADAAAQKRLPQVGGTIVAGCGYAWNNSGQLIALGPSQVRPGTPGTESTSAAAPQPSAAGRTAAPAPPARPAPVEPRPVAAPAMPKVTYFSCMGVTKKTITTPERGRHDAYDTTYFGIITARGDVFPQDAVNLFRQHTGSLGVNNTEDVGTSCDPYQSRSEAQNATNGKISNDARGGWKQVTGIELSL